MIKYEKTPVIRDVAVMIICDKCGFTIDYLSEDLSNDDTLEAQEFLHWSNPCGYGSVFGDGAVIEIDLCQRCVKELLGEFIRVG